ncbi:neuronal acetylcholine receptor subunit alpha-2-like [Littorina saxatilis]
MAGLLIRMVFWTFVLRLEVCQTTGSDAFRLIKDVVKLRSVLATVNPDDGWSVEVNLTFFPINIISLFEREQRFTVSGWFHVTWYDPHLRWSPPKYGNIHRVYVNDDQVWKPDLTIINGADSLQSVSGFSSELTLSSDGRLEWSPGNVFVATCKMDLTRFPFDSQDCSFQLSTWIYTSETVQLVPTSNPIRADNWHENSEWMLESMDVEVYNHTSDGQLYPHVEYHFYLKRRSAFYILKFLAPIVILSVVNAFVFCVPPESGEKVSLAVSTMLSLTVFLAYLTDITPPNSDTVPEVAIFVFLHLTLGACGVVCNILLLKLHFYRIQQSQRRRRKLTERLWTSSVEEKENPHRKNTMESFWSSDLDEDVEDEKEEEVAAKKVEEEEGERPQGAENEASVRGPSFISGRFCSRDSSPPNRSRSADRPGFLNGRFSNKKESQGDESESLPGSNFVNRHMYGRVTSRPDEARSAGGPSCSSRGLFGQKTSRSDTSRSVDGSSFLDGCCFSKKSSQPDEYRSEDEPNITNGSFSERKTSLPSRDHTIHMGAPSVKFSPSTRDRFSTSFENRVRRKRKKCQRERNNNKTEEKLGHMGLRHHTGTYNLHACAKEFAVKSYDLNCLGNVCFAVFLLLSVLVSAVFFLKNI